VSTSKHSDLILDQFTRQAVPFATAPSIKDESALKLIVEFSGAGPGDTVLDVACGPGLVAAAFARVARHVTGIDLTPAMIDRARALDHEPAGGRACLRIAQQLAELPDRAVAGPDGLDRGLRQLRAPRARW